MIENVSFTGRSIKIVSLGTETIRRFQPLDLSKSLKKKKLGWGGCARIGKKSGFKNRNPGPGCLICGQRLLYPLFKPLSTLFGKRLGPGTLGAREFSCAVSGFGQVSMVNRAARDFG